MNPPQTLSLEEIQKILPHRYPFSWWTASPVWRWANAWWG